MASDAEKLRTLLKNILEKMAKSSEGERKELLDKIRDAVDKIDIDVLGLVLDNRVFKKAVNKKVFMQLVEQAFEDLGPENVTPEAIEDSLRYIKYQAVKQAFERGSLDKLRDALKAFAVEVVLSPLIVLAALIALVIIVARYAGLGVIVEDEKIKKEAEAIKEGVIKAEKEVKSFSKDVADIIHMLQARESLFSKFHKELTINIEGLEALLGDEKIEDTTSDLMVFKYQRKELNAYMDSKKVLNMFQNDKQLPAIRELINDGTIQGFSENDMKGFMEKGSSTNSDDKKAFDDLMGKFKTAIMVIGAGQMEAVEQKINEQVEKMKPKAQMNAPGVEQIASTGKEGPGGGNL